jgi:hypothetical protein
MQRRDEAVDRPLWHNGVAVEQQQQLALGSPNRSVVRCRESHVRRERHDRHTRPSRADGLYAAVARCVIDDDDLVRYVRRMLVK